MIKELKYGGYSASPNDHEALEGDLAVAMNLIPEDNTIKPVFPPSVIAKLPWDDYLGTGLERKIMCIHETSAFKHYILAVKYPNYYGNTSFWYLYNWDGKGSLERIGDMSYNDIHSVEPVGNTVVVLADDGLHYILWDVKEGRYRYLGQKPPRIDITFGLSSELVACPGWRSDGTPKAPAWVSQTWEDDRGYMPLPLSALSERSASHAGEDEQTQLHFYPKSIATTGQQTSNLLIWGGGDFSYKDNRDEYTVAEVENITTHVMAAINELIVEEGDNKGRFIMPFYVRYAYKLYDGESYVMHSYPVLMIPNSRGPFFGLNGCPLRDTGHNPGVEIFARKANGQLYINSYTFRGRAYAFASKLCFDAIFPDLSDWKDIIQSVDVFVSPPVFTIDQEGKVFGWNNMDDPGKWDSFYTIGRLEEGTRVTEASSSIFKKWMMETVFPEDTKHDVNGQTKYLFEGYNHTTSNPDQYPMPNYVLAVPEPEKDTLQQRLADIPNFYKIHSFDIDELTGDHSSVPMSGTIELKEGELKTLLARDTLPDDYFTRDTIQAGTCFAYNNRINLAGVSRIQHNPLDAHIAWAKYLDGENDNWNIAVKIKGQERVNVLTSGPGQNDTPMPLFVFYPDPSATTAFVTRGGVTYELKLKEHPFLWGAYWLGSLWTDSVVPTVQQFPTDDAQPVKQYNSVFTSEVNNPFFFPRTGVNSISTGEIMAVCAAVRPVSTSQFGYADLYIFADNGVWVAKITKEGSYSNVTLVSGDICINPDSITQMETTVLFATARGIMLLSGSQAQCISDAIDDKGQMVPIIDQEGYSIPAKIAGLLGMVMEPVGSFEYFLADCRMLYDYRGQRIIAYNPGYSYAYIYSLESNKWGMMQSDISYSVKDYPKALAVTHDGHLVNYSEPCSVGDGSAVVSQLLVTRPLTLDQPDILKTVNTVLQRGLFRKHQGHVQSVLYGSRDLFNWHLVQSSTDENMRGRRGTPYKWYRVALLLRLPSGESIEGCSIDFDPRYTNRLR